MNENQVLEVMAAGAMVTAAWGSLVAARWRVLVAWLAVAQLGVFALLLGAWPPAQAAAWLVAGWLTAAILGLSQQAAPAQPESFDLGDTVLRLAVGVLGMLVALSLAPQALSWFPGSSLPRVFGGLTMVLLGLMQVGLSHHPLRVTEGLLLVLGGFGVFYALLETSLLVTALLAVLEIAVALGCGYITLLLAPVGEER
ncbi:MAG TPA: hypothetical protein G4O04_05110 [Anaerolineae bacterium]|nr:hypothetical protein [Anaerolineae bacterium]HID84927.1 hypothetical protein [Anaerolineales bacterium]HIQ08324.1 hypothetical protein [Anaerolineaceae bacterium]